MQKDAKTDWDERIARRSDEEREFAFPELEPPKEVTAAGGVGQVTLDWSPVEGAVGYLILRSTGDHGPLEPVDHHSGDILSVPGPPYVDTTCTPGTPYHYAIASVPEVTRSGLPSHTVGAVPLVAGDAVPRVDVVVDTVAEGIELQRPWVPMVGSERLSQLLCTDTSGGHEIGAGLEEALRRMHDELGVRTVRAHAIFHDDTHVIDGSAYDFSVVDAIYDKLLGIGLRPVVELGFMPRELASDPSKTVFAYGAIISPPASYERWHDLIRALVEHLVDRYGLEEVLTWDFEVWNEANLEVFWSGTKAEWLHLYDVTAAAVKSVDPRLAVGGPSSAAAGWVDDLLAHAAANGTPVDFVSTHTYGSPPLDVRASLARHGFEHARLLWTEWGVTPRHFNPINDSVFAGVFLLRGMRSAAGRVDALAYWVASDHFEELGRPPRFLHGGFGLQTVGGLAKPRYHALSLLSRLGPVELPVTLSGDGGGSLIEAWASRDRDRIAVLLWNLTLDQTKADGAPELTRTVHVQLPGVDPSWQVSATTLGIGAGDLVAATAELGITDWPTGAQLAELAERSRMISTPLELRDGAVEVTLPMPYAVLLELTPPK
ncbi:xylan 1,4-beta-xylosidase [Kribbella sandramycini]|uniref:Xylan 1,4-beta-xylosidase n=1 Tax=Kribbella sandramycini TaxID=60450 RepID=A0A7Y4P1U3_9ACTN|nr:xylan 1,4-beta-xylosidase [Kribbella sandramycini]MBB6571319.1 xylan 1,4-beta-xylosidase [Kribbella sandramycini]NOL43278.1 xylan 1,4-beta-xylosidase [Kribbella sandramycini]